MIDKVRKLFGIETWEAPRDENPMQPGACSTTIIEESRAETDTIIKESWAETDPDEGDYLLSMHINYDSYPQLLLRRWMDDGSIVIYRITQEKFRTRSEVSIGSEEGMDIRLDAREGVAPFHLCLGWYRTSNLIPYIKITSDKDQTRLNGKRCRRPHLYRLYQGYVIQVGSVELEVIFDLDTPSPAAESSVENGETDANIPEVLMEIIPPTTWIQPYVEACRLAGWGTVRNFVPHLKLSVKNGEFVEYQVGDKLYLVDDVILYHEMVLLKDEKEVMLGSDENAYFRLLGDVEGVAPIHLSIGSEHPGQFWIADKDTPGGTYIDGVRCEPLKHYELKENNQLLLGGVQLNVSFVYRRV